MSAESAPSTAQHITDLVTHVDYRQFAPPALVEPRACEVLPGAVSYLDLPFASDAGWRPLRLDLHVPKRTEAAPVVVYAHAGSFLAGIKEMGPWHSLPGQGIAVASVEYRLSGEVQFPEPIEDVRAAIRWVRAHSDRFNLDASRVAGWGSSAGAYLMLMAALDGPSPGGRPSASTSTSRRNSRRWSITTESPTSLNCAPMPIWTQPSASTISTR